MQKLRWITIAFFIVFGALFHGLFYDLENVFVLFILSIAVFITLVVDKKIQFNLVHLLVLLFVADYWIAIFYAQDHELALGEALKMTNFFLISLLAMGLILEQKLKLLKVFMWTGSGLTIIGVLFSLFRQNRLESTIEYANALAIILLFTGILCILFYIKAKKPYHLFSLSVQLMGLLLTMSRSVWILWIGAILVLIIVFKALRNKETLLRIGTAHLGALFLAMLVKWDMLFFINRVQTIQTKASELQIRFVYWKDSLKVIRDHWLFGTGGGGWSILQSQYQSQSYFVKYVHNHYLQVTMDIGVVGLIIFLALIAVFYIQMGRAIRAKEREQNFWSLGIGIAVTFLLLHAGFDFDLNFPFLLGILCFGISFVINQTMRTFRKNFVIFAAILVILPVILFSGWLTMGYAHKQKGENLLLTPLGNIALAEEEFAKAGQFMPWSSMLHYDRAKGFVLLGNASHNNDYYKKAVEETNEAMRLSPKQTLYRTLLQELQKVK